MDASLEPLTMSYPTRKELKARYSVRRRRDVVTFFAIALFLLLVAFQLFLTLVVPGLLKKRKAFEFHVAKLEMSSQIDLLRRSLSRVKPDSDLHQGEIAIVCGVTDQLAVYTRESLDQLSLKQIFQLKRIFGQYEAVLRRWQEKPPRYYTVQEKINMPVLVNGLKKEIEE